jgi:hypothetical protein
MKGVASSASATEFREATMQRFSRGTECDEAVRHELQAAGIDPVCGEPAVGEVISSVTGRLGAFTFRRAWCHWVADGLVPLEAALAIHADPAARKGLRVGGHHARPAPGQFATVWLDGEGNLNLPLGDKEETVEALAVQYPAAHRRVERGARVDFVADPARRGRGFVDGYHIDTDDGLLLFAETMRRHGVV